MRCAAQTEASYNTTSSADATRCELVDRRCSHNAPWYDETIEATGRTRPCECVDVTSGPAAPFLSFLSSSHALANLALPTGHGDRRHLKIMAN